MDKALLLSPEAPYPLHGGGALRTAALLNHLSRRYRVEAVFFREPGSAEVLAALPPGLVSDALVIELPRHSRSGAARVWRNLLRAGRGVPPLNDRFAGFDEQLAAFARNKRYAIGVIEHFWCAPYQFVLNEFCDLMVLDLHNIESMLYRRRAATGRWPVDRLHRLFAERSERLERRWLPRFNLVLAASARDADAASEIAPQARVEVYPNTIPFREQPAVAPALRVAFSGNFDYDPNKAAVAWFAQRVWPVLRARHAGLEWVLIGKNPGGVHRYVKSVPGVVTTGQVDDALPDLTRSSVAVAPLLSGSGTRMKIIEAWAAGVPVVTTTIGSEGLPGVDGRHWLVRDDPMSFADAVSSLIHSPELSRRISSEARGLYECEFTWESGWKQLVRLGI